MRSNFWGTKPDGSLDVMPGSDLESTVSEAIGISYSRRQPSTFDFNGITVTVDKDSRLSLIVRDWHRALEGCIDPSVGPHSKEELSESELRHDAEVRARNSVEANKRRVAREAEAFAHRKRIEALLEGKPAMKFKDKSVWDEAEQTNGKSEMGKAILAYADRWARLMQLELAEGKTLEEAWEQTSFDADLEGLSGSMQGIATHLLTETWVHGAELRRLHNAYWGVTSDEGTVNPAVIRISTN